MRGDILKPLLVLLLVLIFGGFNCQPPVARAVVLNRGAAAH